MLGTDGSVYEESFVGTNGDNLNTFSGWSKLDTGDITVLDNRLISNGGDAATCLYVQGSSTPPATTYADEFEWWFESTSQHSIMGWRIDGNGDGHMHRWDGVEGEWQIARWTSFGFAAIIGTYASAPPTETLVRSLLRRDGDRFRLYLDTGSGYGDAVIDETDNTHATTGNLWLVSNSDIDATKGGHISAISSGVFTAEASGAPELGALEASGVAAVEVDASGSPELGALEASGAAAVEVSASGSPDLPALEAAGGGTVTDGPTATGAVTLGALAAAGAGTVEVAGTGAPELAALAVAGTGGVELAGAGAGTLPSLEGAGGGSTLSITGSGDPRLPGLEASGAGAVELEASGAVVLGALAASGLLTGPAPFSLDGTPLAMLYDSTEIEEQPIAAENMRMYDGHLETNLDRPRPRVFRGLSYSMPRRDALQWRDRLHAAETVTIAGKALPEAFACVVLSADVVDDETYNRLQLSIVLREADPT